MSLKYEIKYKLKRKHIFVFLSNIEHNGIRWFQHGAQSGRTYDESESSKEEEKMLLASQCFHSLTALQHHPSISRNL